MVQKTKTNKNKNITRTPPKNRGKVRCSLMVSSFYLLYDTRRVTREYRGPGVAQWVRSLDLTAHTSLSPIRRGFAPSFVSYKKWSTRPAVASDKAYQLLAQGRWFSPGTPASSTTKTDRHDIAEILLKVALKHQKSHQINRVYSQVW